MCIIKFMFDYCADSCIWSINKEAEERFGGYLIDIDKFPISNSLKQELINLSNEYDTRLNWDEPQAGIVWSKEQIEDFKKRALNAYNQFVASIDDDIVVENWID